VHDFSNASVIANPAHPLCHHLCLVISAQACVKHSLRDCIKSRVLRFHQAISLVAIASGLIAFSASSIKIKILSAPVKSKTTASISP